jgi:hypothetical protein
VTINLYIQPVALPSKRNITTRDSITACASKYRTPIEMNNRFGSTATSCFTAEMVDQNEDILKCKNVTENMTPNCIYNGAGGKIFFFQK